VGLAIVVPSYQIVELLMKDEFVADRKRLARQRQTPKIKPAPAT
jgi:hypothetical protein